MSKELGKEVAKEPAKAKVAETKTAALMQQEERNTGQVETVTYVNYLKAAGGLAWAPALVLLLTFTQAAQGKILISFVANVSLFDCFEHSWE